MLNHSEVYRPSDRANNIAGLFSLHSQIPQSGSAEKPRDCFITRHEAQYYDPE